MTAISELLVLAGDSAVPVVAGVRDDQLGAPTPCGDYTVKDLLNHLMHVVIGFQAYPTKGSADFTSTPDYLGEGGDWRDRFAGEVGRLIHAWALPGAEEGTAGSMDMPARTLGEMVLGDVLVHSWDLAAATGQSYVPDERVVGELAGPVAEMAPMARQYGVYGPEVAVAHGASPFESLLAVTGRDPRWG
ncbi:TIGR03086 family protein [Pseudonocardiaceae bacterium YIM PH 21723]|nr:TIGR03086 family protein [Pseudonocardiaceae bacterium YIM PH 21723]